MVLVVSQLLRKDDSDPGELAPDEDEDKDPQRRTWQAQETIAGRCGDGIPANWQENEAKKEEDGEDEAEEAEDGEGEAEDTKYAKHATDGKFNGRQPQAKKRGVYDECDGGFVPTPWTRM